MPELPTGRAMVSKPLRPEVLGNTSESAVIEMPTGKHNWTQEENRMLRKWYYDSNNKNARGYIERMHRLCINRGCWDTNKQILRTQMQNIERKKLLSDVAIGEIVGRVGAENYVEAFTKESDEVDVDLKVAIKEEQNRIDVKEVCVSVERCTDVPW